jgi:hypothetical protein
MKRFVQAIFLLASALALGFALYFIIEGRSGATEAARPVATRQVQPESRSVSSQGGAVSIESQPSVTHIPALPNEVILSVSSFNIDQDQSEEQILTVRKTDKTDGKLFIVVADYNEQKKIWIRSWEAETLATKLTTFSIQAKDLVGDRNPCIVCTGMNESGEQTIAIFRRASLQSSYAQVLALTADSIQIGESERPEAYQLGQASGESWSIYVYTSDKESNNILDQIKDRYAWDGHKAQYLKMGSERIPGAQVERATISKILTGSEKDFESFLQGIWYESGKSPSDTSARLILFDRDSGAISFYRSKSQEVFRWTESHSTRYGLYVRSQNESVDDLVRLMDIELTGSDLVAIRVSEDSQLKMDPDDQWDGTYRKLPRDIAASLPGVGAVDDGKQNESPDAAARGLASPVLKLEGPYRTPGGIEINFASPRYSMRSPSAPAESGGFELFVLGDDTVLDLIAMRSDGSPSTRKTYKASYSETRSGKDLIRSLVLSPAKAAIDGLEILHEDDLTLEQRVKG